MASSPDTLSMALFCDFENVALGVRDANYEKFDIKPILERLLLKGSIVVKKAYCDWDRYKGFKATMHEANFELIEIPHVRQSGKNSADIRLVVDALDLCYTKSHVNTFVIISGDSDFSPLVSKLRENAKQVIGVGVKQSTSDLLVANCDEFIFYDDLVREKQRALARRQPPDAQPAARRTPEEERKRKDSMDARRTQAIDMAVETFDALVAERGDSGKIWASVLKEAIKRRKPDFNETWYGFRAFGNLLEEAQARGLLEFGRDEKSGAYVYRSSGSTISTTSPASHGDSPHLAAAAPTPAEMPVERPPSRYFQRESAAPATTEASPASTERREPGRRGRRPDATPAEIAASSMDWQAPDATSTLDPDAGPQAHTGMGESALEKSEPRRRSRGGRKTASTVADLTAAPGANVAPELPPVPEATAPATPVPQAAPEEAGASTGSNRKPAARPRRTPKAAPKARES